MKKCIIGLVFVVCAALLFVAAGAQSQTKSDLPEGYAEPTELPPGAITLEELDRRRAQQRGGAATEGMAPAAPEPMPAAPSEPISAPPAAAPEPMPPETAMPPPPPAAAPASTPRTTVGDTRAAPVDWSKAPPEARGMDAAPSAPEPMAPPPAAPPPMASPAPAAPASAAPAATTAGPGYSDLPKGYAEPTELPPGAVRLEDLQSPYDTMSEPTPQMPGFEESAPAAATPQSTDEIEMVGDDMDEQDSYMPPSRWE